jgi:cell division protein FtsQ
VNARLVDADVVAATSDVSGQNILALDVKEARARVLELPMVKDVEVTRQFPRSVLIKVQEREPWGYWESGGGRYVIDSDGLVLNRGLPPEGAPLVMQLDGGHFLSAGDAVDSDALHLTRTLQERLPEAIPAGRLPAVAFEFREKDGLTVTLKSGLRVTFGDSHDLDYKLAALEALLQRAPDSTFVDLRFGDRIVFQGNFRQ